MKRVIRGIQLGSRHRTEEAGSRGMTGLRVVNPASGVHSISNLTLPERRARLFNTITKNLAMARPFIISKPVQSDTSTQPEAGTAPRTSTLQHFIIRGNYKF